METNWLNIEASDMEVGLTQTPLQDSVKVEVEFRLDKLELKGHYTKFQLNA